jgi:hypothetical protein
MSSRVNHLAVIVSAIVFFAISYVWYSYIFGAQYAAQITALTGKPAMAAGAPMATPLIITFLLGLILAYVIGTALSMRPGADLSRGLGFGLFIGIGVYATMTYLGVAWGGLTLALWAINAGFVVVSMAIMGAIIGAWSSKGAAA